MPAGLNNIVGLKPSLGLVSTYGVVPACRTLDCVSVFALTVDDAWMALSAMAGKDEKDPYSRDRALRNPGPMHAPTKLGVPRAGQRLFFGDRVFEASYGAALERLAKLGCGIAEIDIEPFYETARLLYEGPWVAERAIAVGDLLQANPEALHPVTREIIAGGLRPTAIDAFKAFLEKRYHVKVIVGTHPIPKKYLDMHTHLGTWENSAWKPLIAATMSDEATRASYD